MYVSRESAVRLLRSVGFNKSVEEYSEKDLQEKLHKLPSLQEKLHKPESLELSNLLEDVLTAVKDDEGIVVRVQEGDKPVEEEFDLETGEPVIAKKESGGNGTAPKKRGRPKKVRSDADDEDAPAPKGQKSGDEASPKTPRKVNISGIRELSVPRRVKVTHKLVKHMRELTKFPRDRGCTKSRKEFLKKVILNGEFIGCEWVSCRVLATNDTFRINGNGTSLAFWELMSDGHGDLEEMVTVREFECGTMEDAAHLYKRFDPKQSARSKGNILQTYASGSPELVDLPTKVIKLAATGLAFAKHEKDFRKRTVEEQGDFLLKNEDFVLWLAKILGDQKKNPHIVRMPVVAAMAKTHAVSVDKSTKFWSDVRDGCDDPKTNPKRTIRDWLLSHNFGAKSEKSQKAVASDREGFIYCLQAWNAWRDNEVWKQIKYKPDLETPDVK